VSCSAYLFEWVLTLFSSSFDIEICASLWDQIFFFGDTHIIKIAVAICSVIQKKFILNIENVDGLALIKKAREHVSKDELLMEIEKVRVRTDIIEGMFKMSRDELEG
jgi:hypothetical protein